MMSFLLIVFLDSGHLTKDKDSEHGQSWAVDSPQWTVDSKQWTVDIRQWIRRMVDNGQLPFGNICTQFCHQLNSKI